MRTPTALRRLAVAVALALAVVTASPDPGATGRAGGPVVLDVFTATAHEAARVRAAGGEPVCLVRAGVWEPDRPDAARFPERVRGRPTGRTPGERWLDVRDWSVLEAPLAARIRLCREKGMDTVWFGDPVDWGDPGGFGLTRADWDRFGQRLAALAASAGLEVGTRPDVDDRGGGWQRGQL